MIQLLDKLDILISVDENLSILQELVVNAAANGKFGIDDQTIRDNFQSEELDPINWEIRKVEEIAEFTNGYAFKSSDYRDDGIGIIRMSDLKYGEISVQQLKYVSKSFLSELNSAIQVKPNDLVIGMSGSIGRPCFNRTEETFLLNQRVGKLTPNLSLVTPEYLAISLASLEQHFLQISMGSAIKNLSTAQIKQAKILLPPLAIQKVIVNHYEKFLSLTKSLKASLSSDKSAASKFRNSVIDAVSRAQSSDDLQVAWQRIQQNWELITGTTEAVDAVRTLILDLAVRGQTAPHDLSGLPAEELIKESIQMANRKRSKQSRDNQGDPFEIPKHWVWSTIEELCETQTGTTPKIQDSDNLQELIHYVTAADMVKLKALKNRSVPMSAAKRGGRIAPKDSVLFVGIGATIGKCCLITSPATFNQQIHAATPRNINAQYLSLILASGYFQKICKERTNATAIPILNKSKWETIKIPVPPLNEQKKIAETVSKLFDLCDELESLLTIKSSIAEKFSQSVVSASA